MKSQSIHYTSCPVCGGNTIKEVLKVTDWSVSKELFDLWECETCTARFTQNIPSQEAIGPYYQSEAYISHTDTRKGLVNRLYHRVRSITLKQKRALVEKMTAKSKGQILDIGCGTGAFLNTMQEAGWQITGLEPDAIAVQNAFNLYGIRALPPDRLFQLEHGRFDAITMWHVLEHVHELPAYMQQLHQLLANEGRLFIAVPNYTSADAGFYQDVWAAYDVPRHLYHFSPKSMDALAAKYNFEIISIKRQWFDAVYVSMLSEKYRGGGIIKAFWNGFRSNLVALFNKRRCSSLIYVLKKKG
jgi:2-polyprenyl-3-methyl-5-hydroxy-6-metoxy-1,4-benzoquinol methylase